jgi:hypothetical protein
MNPADLHVALGDEFHTLVLGKPQRRAEPESKRLPVVALFKIVSYEDDHDRRQKDVQDFAAILKRFDPDDTRRFGDDVIAAGLEYEVAGAFLIGKDLAPLCSVEEGQLVVNFITQLRDAESRPSQLFRRPSKVTMTIRSSAFRHRCKIDGNPAVCVRKPPPIRRAAA